MKELEIPKGEYRFAQVTMNQYVHVDGKVICYVVDRSKKETDVIGELIADACNTAQKCGMLPSEVLKQRDEILDAAIELIRSIKTTNNKLRTSLSSMLNDYEKYKTQKS